MRTERLVSVSSATDAWHIAPVDGVTTLCGRVLVEGEYDVAGPDEFEYPELLRVCRFCRKRELADV